MRVDTPRRDHAACGIDFAWRAGQALRQGDDAAPGDADVSVEDIGRGGDAGIADDELDRNHALGAVHAMDFRLVRSLDTQKISSAVARNSTAAIISRPLPYWPVVVFR